MRLFLISFRTLCCNLTTEHVFETKDNFIECILVVLCQMYLTEELPPQLTLHLASGHAAAGPSGEVLVYPGSIFHIDCLFDRRKGNPEWKTAKPGKRYPKGKNCF